MHPPPGLFENDWLWNTIQRVDTAYRRYDRHRSLLQRVTKRAMLHLNLARLEITTCKFKASN